MIKLSNTPAYFIIKFKAITYQAKHNDGRIYLYTFHTNDNVLSYKAGLSYIFHRIFAREQEDVRFFSAFLEILVCLFSLHGSYLPAFPPRHRYYSPLKTRKQY